MKSVLHIIPYDQLYPATNGGMQRCLHVLHQLTKYFRVTVIINQDSKGFLEAAKYYPALLNAKVYSTRDTGKVKDIFSFLPVRIKNALRYRWYKKRLTGSADGYFLQYYPVLKRLLKTEKFDVIILEKLGTLNAVSVIRKFDKHVTIIYNAHNIDTVLAKTRSNKHYNSIKKVESSLYENVDAMIACSQHDLDDLVKMNKYLLRAAVIPNGVFIEKVLYDNGVRQEIPEYLLFCGSLGYGPNTEGLLWFYDMIWPAIKIGFPPLKLLVVGSGEVPVYLNEMAQSPDVIFTGKVEDVKPYYNKASLAIVPLKEGSGTRLKILEAMSLGLPVVSTGKGAEGISYTNNLEIIIADEEKQFGSSILTLLKNKELRISMQAAARKMVVEKYDWNIIGETLTDFINMQPR